MGKIKVLSENDIRKIINLKIAINAVEEAYKQKSNNKGNVWPLVFYEYEHNVFDLDIRSGNLMDSGAYGLKLISYNENNPKKGLSKVNATALVCNDKTGEPLAILNAAPITSYRTGAAAAIGAKYLAKKDSKNLLIVGTGNIAKYSTAATLFLMSSIENVYLYNPKRIIENNELLSFKEEVNSLLKESNKETTVVFNSVEDISKIANISDIIITTTPSDKALIDEKWVKPGTHFSCMGACMVGKQEIDKNIFSKARTFADDEQQCLKQGEAQCAYNKKLINKFDSEIGEVILGKAEGRKSENDITIFDSTGLFLQDLATSMELINEANKNNIGVEIEL
jgi:ornithine cyclodeaminase/alanine dehydrogenase